MPEKQLRNAYRLVLNDMLYSECSLLVDKYDAKNRNDSFMYGVAIVMNWIAHRAGEDEFSSLFIENMGESKLKTATEGVINNESAT